MKVSSKESPPSALASTKAELRQLNENTKATATELKAFLAELKGRSPQEMLGIVAASQLFRALVLSTVVVVAGLLVFTAVPFFLGGEEKTAPAQAETKAPAPPPDAPAPATEPGSAETTPVETLPNVPDLSNLGVTEKKMAPPTENPLETREDDFLKGLE